MSIKGKNLNWKSCSNGVIAVTSIFEFRVVRYNELWEVFVYDRQLSNKNFYDQIESQVFATLLEALNWAEDEWQSFASC